MGRSLVFSFLIQQFSNTNNVHQSSIFKQYQELYSVSCSLVVQYLFFYPGVQSLVFCSNSSRGAEAAAASRSLAWRLWRRRAAWRGRLWWCCEAARRRPRATGAAPAMECGRASGGRGMCDERDSAPHSLESLRGAHSGLKQCSVIQYQ